MTPLIVGGGPAGSAAAIALARHGIRPLLIERSRAPEDALCGGFLSWRSLDTLARLGIDADRLNPVPVRSVRLFAGDRVATSPLPRPAVGVSRRRLDALLLARAGETAAIERGVTVRAAEPGRVRLADGATIPAATLFLATGKLELRGQARPDAARGADPALGLRVRLAASPLLDRLVGDAIELHLFAGGYAGLVRQEDGSVNCCMATRRSRLAAAGRPIDLLHDLARECPALGNRFAAMASDAPIDAVANVPYGWRATTGAAGVFRLGDQAGVIPSLAGEGMGIALASGIAAARAFAGGGAAAAVDWQPQFARTVRRPISIAGAVWHLAEQPAIAPWLVRAAHPPLIRMIARATRIAPGI